MRRLQGHNFVKASEPGTAGLASNQVIRPLIDYEHLSSKSTSALPACSLTLRLLILQCCCSGLSSNLSLSRSVLLGALNGGRLLGITLGKVVLLTAAKLPSDKTLTPAHHAAFFSIRPAIPLRHSLAQQHQNPLCCSCVLLTLASRECLESRVSSPCCNPLTFLIAEGPSYQVKIPQTVLCIQKEKAVSS